MTGEPGDAERLARLQQRWSRLELIVRCGLRAGEPAYAQLYVHLGARLARRSGRPAGAVAKRVLTTLLRSAEDVALPLAWRTACLDHVDLPLARATAWCRGHDPRAAAALEAEVARARERLCIAPSAQGA